METVIYGDVLVAINFVINLAVLSLTQRLTGVVARRWRRYLGAFVGGLCAFAIFLPLHGLWWELLLRLGSTAAVMFTVYGGQKLSTLLRVSAVFFSVGFLLAGFLLAAWFVLPERVFAIRNGIFYMNITPLVLLGCVACAYLFVLVFDRIFDRGQPRQCVWQCSITRRGHTVRIPLFLDTGNQLLEPFSGLPVMVVGLRQAQPLLSPEEYQAVLGGNQIPPGMRPVFYSGLGSQGLLYAVRPEHVVLWREKQAQPGEGYLAVSPQELDCQDCCGVFGPRWLDISVHNEG